MPKWWMLPVMGLLTVGCSMVEGRRDYDGVTRSWYCIKHSDGSRQCEKRNLRNGVPADDVVYERLVVPAEESVPDSAVTVEKKAQVSQAGNAVRWSRDTLNAVNAVEDTSGLEVENTGPALKKPRDTVDIWDKSTADK